MLYKSVLLYTTDSEYVSYLRSLAALTVTLSEASTAVYPMKKEKFIFRPVTFYLKQRPVMRTMKPIRVRTIFMCSAQGQFHLRGEHLEVETVECCYVSGGGARTK
jgi:hypothetical protein